jgi:hypothetical protein
VPSSPDLMAAPICAASCFRRQIECRGESASSPITCGSSCGRFVPQMGRVVCRPPPARESGVSPLCADLRERKVAQSTRLHRAISL